MLMYVCDFLLLIALIPIHTCAFGSMPYDEDDCNISAVELEDFEVWRREEGYWFGEYTFLGAEGDPFISSDWHYDYDHYYGFIHIELNGNSISQRNVFIYPPRSIETCVETSDAVVGDGVCGVNGNEKIFSADQSAVDCKGNLAGPYYYGAYTLDTTTTVLGDDTVIYAVKLPEAYGGGFNQNQLTTLPGNGVRVRTAQGFDFLGMPSYASFYRESLLSNQSTWLAKLSEVRTQLNITDSDLCGWDSSNTPSGVSCEDHFGFEV